ncbi:MAG TPA: hypothetical protein HA302_04295 [Thermococcaceae archaeon]|uniref:Uncharacterized protein n=2 Tax=Thermococcus sibiricus TaxID=172049 RepID=C6A274_THESM|nr:hypothetical protein [Thermococcus sibiricus]ACS89719.1 hypothetical protein TSIB_0654 [Thermococcus sibiricus MM 739]KUK17048.1 MAG: Uncharacterized protein XD54_1653 [Thermococcus sibiricus]KUK27849.1 MAG: Uncharacterized protein XD61_1610 [Thermococcus sp. 40_45]HII67220.1 hypothetical protein [Thermococcaceae archaeon]
MKKHMLSMLMVLLLIGAYATYAVSQPKLPEVKGCVNPFREVKPLERKAENWSSVHVFAKVLASKDIRGLAKPWEIDYKNVKVAKHTVEYNGEKIEMLAMALPLKDGKHLIAYYEFSKPVQGVKTRSYLLEFTISEDNKRIATKAIGTNGEVTPLSTCKHECSTASDCGYFGRCISYCCDRDWGCVVYCCGDCLFYCGSCARGSLGGCAACLYCVLVSCPYCSVNCCEEEGTYCDYLDPGP